MIPGPISPIVTRNDVYRIPHDRYHADQCTAEPTISASVVDAMVDGCARRAWFSHPRLNPDFEKKNTREFDIGRAAHFLALEPEQFAAETLVIEADNYRSEFAQQQRRVAYSQNKTPLLVRERDMLRGMRAALFADDEIRRAFTDGHPERSVFARDRTTGVWRKIRPDLIPYHAGYLVDYKAVDNANPARFGDAAYRMGWFRRGAFYLDTFEMATDELPKRYLFICQEREPPYLATLNELTFEDIELGRIDSEWAVRRFAECMERGSEMEDWPGYTGTASKVVISTMPTYAHYQIADRHQRWADEALRRGADTLQRPLEKA